MVINFYSTIGKYGCFSNFSRHNITVNEVTWPTTEHYFQARKFTEERYSSQILAAKTPSEAAKLGRNRSWPLRKDWELVKNDVMRFAVLTKFTQNKNIANILLSTGDALLVEHTINDNYWGDGGDGSGKNMLGKILMEVRELINNNF